MKLLFIDTETGGLDPTVHPILSLGALVVDHGEEVAAKEWLICDPDLDAATPEALAINKLDPTILRTSGCGPVTAWLDFQFFVHRFVGTDPRSFVLVGQNVEFDLGFLRRLVRTIGQVNERQAVEDLLGRRPLDTISVARFLQLLGYLDPESSCALSVLSAKFAPTLGQQTHGALDDCRRTRAVLRGMVIRAALL